MSILAFPCGCAVATSTFGDFPIMGAVTCGEHRGAYGDRTGTLGEQVGDYMDALAKQRAP